MPSMKECLMRKLQSTTNTEITEKMAPLCEGTLWSRFDLVFHPSSAESSNGGLRLWKAIRFSLSARSRQLHSPNHSLPHRSIRTVPNKGWPWKRKTDRQTDREREREGESERERERVRESQRESQRESERVRESQRESERERQRERERERSIWKETVWLTRVLQNAAAICCSGIQGHSGHSSGMVVASIEGLKHSVPLGVRWRE